MTDDALLNQVKHLYSWDDRRNNHQPRRYCGGRGQENRPCWRWLALIGKNLEEQKVSHKSVFTKSSPYFSVILRNLEADGKRYEETKGVRNGCSVNNFGRLECSIEQRHDLWSPELCCIRSHNTEHTNAVDPRTNSKSRTVSQSSQDRTIKSRVVCVRVFV